MSEQKGSYLDKAELARLKADLAKAGRLAADAEREVDDAKDVLRMAEDDELAAKEALDRFFARQTPETAADAVALLTVRGAWGAEFDGRTALTNGHAMAVVPGSHEVGFFRVLTAETVAKIVGGPRDALGIVSAAAIAAAAADDEAEPRVRVGPAVLNSKLLREWVAAFSSLAPDERVEVFAGGDLDPVEFRAASWSAFVMPMRGETPSRALVPVVSPS